jgi:protein tyrosine/serine phosphatase
MSRNHGHPLLAAALLLSLPTVTRAATPEIAGIANFHQVNERVYRGAQPADTAWPDLAKLGVRCVVDLRRPEEHSTVGESTAVAAAGMRYVNFPMDGFATPTRDQIDRALVLMDGNDKVFVHCKQGRDRTGTVIAAYRISREHWENARAMAEARDVGLHWFEGGMKRFIAGYRAEAVPIAVASSIPSARADTTSATATVGANP